MEAAEDAIADSMEVAEVREVSEEREKDFSTEALRPPFLPLLGALLELLDLLEWELLFLMEDLSFIMPLTKSILFELSSCIKRSRVCVVLGASSLFCGVQVCEKRSVFTVKVNLKILPRVSSGNISVDACVVGHSKLFLRIRFLVWGKK